jgi:hypothetical protein
MIVNIKNYRYFKRIVPISKISKPRHQTTIETHRNQTKNRNNSSMTNLKCNKAMNRPDQKPAARVESATKSRLSENRKFSNINKWLKEISEKKATLLHKKYIMKISTNKTSQLKKWKISPSLFTIVNKKFKLKKKRHK